MPGSRTDRSAFHHLEGGCAGPGIAGVKACSPSGQVRRKTRRTGAPAPTRNRTRTVSPSRGYRLETYLEDPSWWTVLSQAGKEWLPEIMGAHQSIVAGPARKPGYRLLPSKCWTLSVVAPTSSRQRVLIATIGPFGPWPRGPMVAINPRCLDEVGATTLNVQHFDGKSR